VAARAWSLTPRQTAVLELIAGGDSNRTIASKLLCAERTVEMHVTALLARAEVESRSALISAFFNRL
jgi:DNA-binding NarL/FixJ family response regulator